MTTVPRRAALAAALTPIALAAPAQAQTGGPFALTWSTIDGGGGRCDGGPFALTGTIGQPDAGGLSGGPFLLAGGLWAATAAAPCYANCDGSTTVPVLNALDFSCFLQRFQSGSALPAAQQPSAYANCDGSTTVPALNALDFSCYLTRYRAGCP